MCFTRKLHSFATKFSSFFFLSPISCILVIVHELGRVRISKQWWIHSVIFCLPARGLIQLSTFSTCVALVTLKHLLQKNSKCRNLLENDTGGGSLSGLVSVRIFFYFYSCCHLVLVLIKLLCTEIPTWCYRSQPKWCSCFCPLGAEPSDEALQSVHLIHGNKHCEHGKRESCPVPGFPFHCFPPASIQRLVSGTRAVQTNQQICHKPPKTKRTAEGLRPYGPWRDAEKWKPGRWGWGEKEVRGLFCGAQSYYREQEIEERVEPHFVFNKLVRRVQ